MDRRVEYSGVITEDLFLRSQRLHRAKARPIMVVAMTLTIASILLLSNYDMIRKRGPFLGVAVAFFGALVGLVAARMIVVFEERAWAKAYDRTPGLRAGVSGSVGDDGLHLRSPRGTAHVPWGDLTRVLEGTGIVLLYWTPNGFYIVPREFFASDEDWELALLIIRDNSRKIH